MYIEDVFLHLNEVAEKFVLEAKEIELICPGSPNIHWVFRRRHAGELAEVTAGIYCFFDVQPAGAMLVVTNFDTGEPIGIGKYQLRQGGSPSTLTADVPHVGKNVRLGFLIEH